MLFNLIDQSSSNMVCQHPSRLQSILVAIPWLAGCHIPIFWARPYHMSHICIMLELGQASGTVEISKTSPSEELSTNGIWRILWLGNEVWSTFLLHSSLDQVLMMMFSYCNQTLKIKTESCSLQSTCAWEWCGVMLTMGRSAWRLV